MKFLASVFAVDLCAYAIMSNHYHVVLRIDVDAALSWNDLEVAQRWTRVFNGHDLVKRWMNDAALNAAELEIVEDTVAQWRQRLYDLSWFMRCLNESIARRANAEDRCTGRFWEGRFKSQALLDERAVLSCMAYVDLNPVRAAMAATPEASDYTSIQERIRQPDRHGLYAMNDQASEPEGLPFSLKDYLEFVDWAGRWIRQGKKGAISETEPPIFQRMRLDAVPVLEYLSKKEELPLHAIGPVVRLRAMAEGLGMKFLWGISVGARLCPAVT
jgi:REP element-mobilizing transposase RayT